MFAAKDSKLDFPFAQERVTLPIQPQQFVVGLHLHFVPFLLQRSYKRLVIGRIGVAVQSNFHFVFASGLPASTGQLNHRTLPGAPRQRIETLSNQHNGVKFFMPPWMAGSAGYGYLPAIPPGLHLCGDDIPSREPKLLPSA